MKELEHEGQTYILKSEMENIIKDRISRVAQRATAAEDALKEAEKRISKAEKGLSSVDMLNQQIGELQGKLKTSEQRFSRYQSISKHGLTDPDLIEAIEWSYERSQKGSESPIELGEWLDKQVSDPDSAPMTIRPHLQALRMLSESSEGAEGIETPSEAPPAVSASTQEQLAQLAPRTNVGAIPAPDSPGFLDRALRDPEFYAANRDKVMQAWKSQNRRQR